VAAENRYRPSAEPRDILQRVIKELQAQRKEQTQIKHLMSDRQSTMPGLENIVEELREVKETQKAMETNLYKKLRAIWNDVQEHGKILYVIQECVHEDKDDDDEEGNEEPDPFRPTNDEAENLKRLNLLKSQKKW
jgi:beta-phosphoglucomutase-like phosphatase (HAD superfamily)